jgi:hypothetical protein
MDFFSLSADFRGDDILLPEMNSNGSLTGGFHLSQLDRSFQGLSFPFINWHLFFPSLGL